MSVDPFHQHTMSSLGRRALFVAACVLLLPLSAHAQSTIAGVVRDATGAVLPGVTVEASSPVLIEKLRTAVTDNTGQYRLAELRPGTYSLAFTLTGFATVKRDGVEVSGGGSVISINIDMRVGGVQETVTVSGDTPVVDVQSSTRKQMVLDDAVVEALPASRGYGNLLSAVPGIQNNSLDNGSNPTMVFFTAHGGRGNEGTVQIDGMNVGSAFNGGGVASFGYDTANAAEIQVTVTGGLGEVDRGGPAFNMVPKTGGNTFTGSAFYSTAGEWSQGSNLDDTLQELRLRRSARSHQELGRQLLDGRADQTRPAVVLRAAAHIRQSHSRARAVRQRERRQPELPGRTSRIGI